MDSIFINEKAGFVKRHLIFIQETGVLFKSVRKFSITEIRKIIFKNSSALRSRFKEAVSGICSRNYPAKINA